MLFSCWSVVSECPLLVLGKILLHPLRNSQDRMAQDTGLRMGIGWMSSVSAFRFHAP